MRVLIVDDSALVRRIICKALRDSAPDPMDCDEADNGAEGIAALERMAASGQNPDLILCDAHMPELDGIGFLRRRTMLGLTSAPVIIITADSSDPMVNEALAAGAYGFIAKPFSAEQIREQVAAAMECA